MSEYPFWPEGPIREWSRYDWLIVLSLYAAGFSSMMLGLLVFLSFGRPPL